ncbi:hypothetical protein NMG60_11008029 [Bertholletia excelsa]
MFISHGVRQFLRNYKPCVHGIKYSGCWKTGCDKWVHSLKQFKQKKIICQIKRQMMKPLKSADKEVKQEVYARDIIWSISNILRYSTWDSAQEQLEKLPLRWDSYMVNQVLKTHPPLEKAWLFFNWSSRLRGFKHDQYTYTTMLDIFGEARRISSMNYVFRLMQEKGIKVDVVTYTSLMHWLSNDGDIDGAIKVWEEMKARRCHPTVVSYTAYMKILFDHNKVKEAAEVYKEMLQSGCSPNCYTYTVLMNHLASSGKFKEVVEIFNKMQEAGVQPDKATCNILIEKCCKTGETWAMTQILQYMKENSLVLRYSVCLEAFETLKTVGESDVLLREVNPHISLECTDKDETDENNAIIASSDSIIDRGVILDFLRKRNFVSIDCLLTSMMDKNIQLDSRTISTIIEVNSAHCRRTGAMLAFEYSMKMGLKVERTAYLALIGVFIRTNSFLKVVDIVEKMVGAGIYLGMYLGALLIYRLGHARKPNSAAKIFDLLPDEHKNTATYTALVAAYFMSGKANKGLKMFMDMRNKGVTLALGTYNVLLSGLEKCGKVHEMEYYRKEKKNLLADGHSAGNSPLEVMICNCLFAGDALP